MTLASCGIRVIANIRVSRMANIVFYSGRQTPALLTE